MRQMEFGQITFLTTLLLLVCSCASQELRIESEPPAADVLVADKVIGQTPLTLKDSELKAILDGEKVSLEIRKPGFEPKAMIFEPKGAETVQVKLKAFDPDYFSKVLIPQFANDSNNLVREALTIQGLLVGRKYDDAETRLKEFQKVFPNIAAGYVLQANIDLAKNKRTEALSNLLRAQTLDPTDKIIKRLIEQSAKGTEGSP